MFIEALDDEPEPDLHGLCLILIRKVQIVFGIVDLF